MGGGGGRGTGQKFRIWLQTGGAKGEVKLTVQIRIGCLCEGVELGWVRSELGVGRFPTCGKHYEIVVNESVGTQVGIP